MSTQELATTATTPPPFVALFQMVTGYYISQALYVAAKLGIADVLKDGPRHYTTLAQLTGTHAPSLYRLLRLLTSAGVCDEQENGHFGLTAIGAYLQTDTPGSLRHRLTVRWAMALAWVERPFIQRTDGRDCL
jgi:hypothetical protein